MTARDEHILERLSETVASGAPLAVGLRAAADEAGESAFARSLRTIAVRLEKGDSLETALKPNVSKANAHIPAAIRAGVESGRLGQVLMELVRHQRFQRRVRSSFVSNLLYPAILLMILAAVLTLIFALIVPMFAQMFDEFAIGLPAPTLVLVTISQIRWQALASVAVIPAAAIALRMLLGKSNWRLFLSTMPVFGQLMHWNGIAQLSRLLPIFLRQGIPLADALHLTAVGIRDANIAQATRRIARQIQSGGTLQSLIADSHRIPQTAAVIIGWGEQHDCLPEALELLSDYSEGRINRCTQWLSTVIPPLVFLLIATTIGFVILGLILPLITLVEGLS